MLEKLREYSKLMKMMEIRLLNDSKKMENQKDSILSLDFSHKGSPEEIDEIISIYQESGNQEKMYQLLSNQTLRQFRNIKEIIELAKLYNSILETEIYLNFVARKEKYNILAERVFDVITSEEIGDKKFTCEMQKTQIYDILEKNDFHIINFEGTGKVNVRTY